MIGSADGGEVEKVVLCLGLEAQHVTLVTGAGGGTGVVPREVIQR